ncbi:MAG: Na/Pi cotransporter family protein [Lachnospiraceae bacterium]|nr:Na/Pi cotransporter family protein [Lachnospiraceae bacterium]
MNEVVKIIFGLLGGLALFLYGMNTMSDNLTKVAGARMKNILGFLTKNPLMGAVAGALVTACLQSSSATTVMVIGFVSAGLMGLPQAISVIFGANIGTTMTAQLIAFKLSDYIYPIIFIGFIINFLSKKEKTKNIGMVILSFGLLFEGIEIMGGVMKPLAQSPIFTDLISRVKDFPILGVFVGMIMTLVVQSSSATIAVLQSFASTPLSDGATSAVGLMGAIPILLGDNIGTTITALLASIGQSKNAKRTAIAHCFFNVSGSIIFLILLRPFAAFVQFISPKGNEVDVISRQIANSHTVFNVAMTLVWLPLIPLMVKMVLAVLPEREEVKREVIGQALYIDKNLLKQPQVAIYLVSKELRRTPEMFKDFFSLLTAEINGKRNSECITSWHDKNGNIVKNKYDFEQISNILTKITEETREYISLLFSEGVMSDEQADEAAGYMSVADNLGRISARGEEIVEEIRRSQELGHTLSKDAITELETCISYIMKMFKRSMEMLESEGVDIEGQAKIIKAKNKMRKAVKKFNKAHLSRVNDKRCDTDMTSIYTEILYNLDRISDNCVSLSEEANENIRLIHREALGV